MLEPKITPYQERSAIRFPAIDPKKVEALADTDPNMDIFLGHIDVLEGLVRNKYVLSRPETTRAIKKCLTMAVNDLNVLTTAIDVKKGVYPKPTYILPYILQEAAGFLLSVATSVFGDNLLESGATVAEAPYPIIETLLDKIKILSTITEGHLDEKGEDDITRIDRINDMREEFVKAYNDALIASSI
ncbi:hypothetical protein HZA39_01790 [Candidatus Peregrinibacteria bacterium]|nr:hypothetical protein [Candidatus Peregrinibacteria bacterium]